MDYTQLNGIVLAYAGDAIYEVYIRDYLIQNGQTRPNILHKMSTYYVSAKAQAVLIQKMRKLQILNKEEEQFYRRGRNAKCYTKAKNTDQATYARSTGFEAVLGFLH
ncbi:MAG: Mini-ribonuclease 3, partial [Lactobacillales bacterium]|nr:Mini-ribonuclease 3 [Lactobacillales bacterium]